MYQFNQPLPALVLLLLVLVTSLGVSHGQVTLTVSSGNKSAAFQCPEQFGYYDDLSDCSKYFVCVFGEALHETCTGGLYFSSELLTCDWPRNVKCSPENKTTSAGQMMTTTKPLAAHTLSAADFGDQNSPDSSDHEARDPVDILYDDSYESEKQPARPNELPDLGFDVHVDKDDPAADQQPKLEDEEALDLQRSRTTVQQNFATGANSGGNNSLSGTGLQRDRRGNGKTLDLSRLVGPIGLGEPGQPPNSVVKWSHLLNGTQFGDLNGGSIFVEPSSNNADIRFAALQESASLRSDLEARALELTSTRTQAPAQAVGQRGPERRRGGIPHFQNQRFQQAQHFRHQSPAGGAPGGGGLIRSQPAEVRDGPGNDQGGGGDGDGNPKRQDFGGIITFDGYPSFDGAPDSAIVMPLMRDGGSGSGSGGGGGGGNFRQGQGGLGRARGRPRVAPLGPRIPDRNSGGWFNPDEKPVFFDDERDFEEPKAQGHNGPVGGAAGGPVAANNSPRSQFTQPPPVFPPHRELRAQTSSPTFRPLGSQTTVQTAPPRITPPQPVLRAASQSFGHPSQGPAPGAGHGAGGQRPGGRHRPPYGGFEERHAPPRSPQQQAPPPPPPPAPFLSHSPNYFERPPQQPDFRPAPQPSSDNDRGNSNSNNQPADPRGPLSGGNERFRPNAADSEERQALPPALQEPRQPVIGPSRPGTLSPQQNFGPQQPPPVAPVVLEDVRRSPKLPPPPPPPPHIQTWELERTRFTSTSTTPAHFAPPRLQPATRPPRPRGVQAETTFATEAPPRVTQTFPDYVDELRRPQVVAPPQTSSSGRGRSGGGGARGDSRHNPSAFDPPPPPPKPVSRPKPVDEEDQLSPPSARKNSGIPLEHGQPFGLIDYPFDEDRVEATEVEPTRPTPSVTQVAAGRPARLRPTSNPRASATSTGRPGRRSRPKQKKIKVHQLAHLAQRSASRPAPLFPVPKVGETATKCDPKVCRLPDCKCGNPKIPGNLGVKDVPQIVMLTFDDAVNDLNWEMYQDIFDTGRKNPNNCPLLATFYVSHEWTDYSQVQTLYSRGHEMASHGVTHSFGEKFSKNQWTKEIEGQREILNLYGGVKLEDVRGMRAPFLQIGGNKMFEMLYESNFTYDSSMPVFENNPPMWPYTLDYAENKECMIAPCPTKSYPGVWEVGMVMWEDLRGGRCSMGDACQNPNDEDGVYTMLKKNFNRHYTTNRAPFGLYYHSAWFTKEHHKKGFMRFLDEILTKPDVYLTTKYQMIQWMREPTPTSRIKSFEPWDCRRPDPERPAACPNPAVCNVRHGSDGARFMKTCQPCPTTFPWVGNNGFQKKVSATR